MNRINTIQQIVNQHNPDIFTIHEANIYDTDNLNLIQIQNYNMEIDNLLETNKLARVVTFIKKEIKYTRLQDLESKIEPVIWLQIHQQGNKNYSFKVITDNGNK